MEQGLNLTVEKLDDAAALSNFCCGVKSMDDFLHHDFQLSLDNHFCRAYVVRCGSEIVAMFALSYDSIDLDSDDKEELEYGISGSGTPKLGAGYSDTFYSKRRYPALDIAYLAVRKDYRGMGIGESVMETIAEQAIEQDFAGCQFLSVEALKTAEYSAVGFYCKCGFAPNELPDANKDTLRMFRTLYAL